MNKTLSIKCPAKVNLALNVKDKREDGYHNLEMIMHAVKLFDFLNITVCPADKTTFKISSNLSFLPSDEKNLCVKASMLFLEKIQKTASVRISIKKNIPVGAGLGGGSSDAAGTLIALNELFCRPFSKQSLADMAKKIGADVPFFIYKGCMLAEGIGEILSPLPMLENVFFVIAKPKYGISTPYVYKNLCLDDKTPHPDIKTVITAIQKKDLHLLGKVAENTLESVVIKDYPEIEEYKNILKQNGAIYSLMSGSGSSVFGVFDNPELAKNAANRLKKIAKYVFIA